MTCPPESIPAVTLLNASGSFIPPLAQPTQRLGASTRMSFMKGT